MASLQAPVVCSIDYSRTKMQGIRTMAGAGEERCDLVAGPDGRARCTWSDGEIFVTDVPNLTLLSRASALAIVPKPKAKKKAKAKAKPASKAKALAESSSSDEHSTEEDEGHAPEPDHLAAQGSDGPSQPIVPEVPRSSRSRCSRRRPSKAGPTLSILEAGSLEIQLGTLFFRFRVRWILEVRN